MKNLTSYCCSPTQISFRGDEILHVSRVVSEIWRRTDRQQTDDRRQTDAATETEGSHTKCVSLIMHNDKWPPKTMANALVHCMHCGGEQCIMPAEHLAVSNKYAIIDSRLYHRYTTQNDYSLVFITEQNIIGISPVTLVVFYCYLGIHMTCHNSIMWKHDVIHKKQKYITHRNAISRSRSSSSSSSSSTVWQLIHEWVTIIL